ncbi:MAG: tyrosine-type recombinase/integrase [Endomicrobium sp.]|uniref:tyrosine-type recombinase/integrase n=1 Tax=Candidatus Endomicrobiellum pyrsonymphae TaxID=1408203 RepID=UPI0035723C70|nr:tyrosine-type recombinase/integrase [Endomicrobium sp.]
MNKRYIQAKKSKFICFFEGSDKALDEEILSSVFIKLKKKINAEHKRKILSDNFSFRSLRHKFITTLINSGQPIKKISTIADRASIAMTERIVLPLFLTLAKLL